VRDRVAMDAHELEELRTAAVEASTRAYCEYSGFRVGAAVRTASKAVYAGCNIENASYSLTICAERVAIFRSVAAGERAFSVLLLYTPTPEPRTPCGACRQVLAEFGEQIEVVCVCDGPGVLTFTSGELLPAGFSL